jgi:peptidoglycan/xylan/chitin deacetylase (PgdA/CDA1 family)
MASRSWKDVSCELDRWAARGLKARFWVRDDDACEASAPLARLHEFAARYDITIGLAIIPAKMHPSLQKFISAEGRRFHPMCHGWQHVSHAPAGCKPSEFGEGRPVEAAIKDARLALSTFRNYFADPAPVFVPPFGQISGAMTRALPAIGFAGVSAGPGWLERKLFHLPSLAVRFPAVNLPRRPGIRRLDVHIDPIDWQKGTAHSADTICDAIVRSLHPRWMGFLSSEAPVGLVTHHLAHDDRIWAACKDVMDVLREHRAVEFLDAGQFFGATARQGSN